MGIGCDRIVCAALNQKNPDRPAALRGSFLLRPWSATSKLLDECLAALGCLKFVTDGDAVRGRIERRFYGLSGGQGGLGFQIRLAVKNVDKPLLVQG